MPYVRERSNTETQKLHLEIDSLLTQTKIIHLRVFALFHSFSLFLHPLFSLWTLCCCWEREFTPYFRFIDPLCPVALSVCSSWHQMKGYCFVFDYFFFFFDSHNFHRDKKILCFAHVQVSCRARTLL